MSERWIGFNEGVEVASYLNRGEANAALERREVQSVSPAKAKQLRYAQIRGARTVDEVRAYLPENYHVFRTGPDDGRLLVTIRGVDQAGWTLDGYVLPRLASGMMFGEERPAPADAAKEAT